MPPPTLLHLDAHAAGSSQLLVVMFLAVPVLIACLVAVVFRKRYGVEPLEKTSFSFVPFDALGIEAETCVDCKETQDCPMPSVRQLRHHVWTGSHVSSALYDPARAV